MTPVEDMVRERLSSYAAAVPTSAPDLVGAARTARRQDRRRTGVAAAAAIVALTVAVGGSLLVTHRGDSGLGTATRPRQVVRDVTRVPGFVERAGVTLPDRVEPMDVASDGDEVWVLGDRYDSPGAMTSTPVLLHGQLGTPLVPVDTRDDFAAPVLRDGHAFVIRYGTGHQGNTLQMRDAATGSLQTQAPLSAYGADQAVIVPTGDGTGPLAIVLTAAVPTGPLNGIVNGKLRVGILGDDGTVSGLTPVVRGGDFAVGDSIGGSLNPVITLTVGSPRYLFYGDTRLDLRTGLQQLVNPSPSRSAAAGGDLVAVADIGGRVVYVSQAGVVYAGAPSSLLPAVVEAPAASDPLDPTSEVPPHLTLVHGRLFLTPAEPPARGVAVPQPVTELDPVTLKPTATVGVIAGDVLTNAQTLAAYIPSGQVGDTSTGGVVRVFAPVPG